MKTIIYLLQVSACTGIFYGFYFLLLRRLTFFTLNRWYLLATLLLSFVIPAINIHVDTAQQPAIMQPVMFVNRIQVIDEPVKAITQVAPQKAATVFDWATPVKAVYISMAVISILHLLFTLLVFYRRSRAERLMQIGNVKVLKGGSKQGNSSFLNVIFVNNDELEPAEMKQIIAHEMLHVKLLHSADRIVARLVQIVLWFNPFVYCYIRSIEENHEFEVDRMITGYADKSMYATLLFKLSVSGQSYLMHSFSKVPLKSRITMLFNKPTSNMKKIIYLLIAPVVLISCLAFANLKAKSTANDVNKHPFYTLTKSTNVKGVALETRKIFLPNGKGTMGHTYKAGEKVVFIVDGKVFTEQEVDKVKQLVKTMDIVTFATGKVKDYRGKTDKSISLYNSYFEFKSDKINVKATADTIKYRQKVKQTAAQKLAAEKWKAENEAYKQTDEYKQKMAEASRVMGQTLTYKVTEYKTAGPQWYTKEGFVVLNNNSEFFIGTHYGQAKQLKDLLKIGDEIEIKVLGSGMWGKGIPVLIEPAVITKDGKEIYHAAEAAPIPKTAFLFEANRVRFTDGQVTNIKKYPNGKWKSAVVEVVNGYKIKFNIKPDAPDFKGIEWGDHVTFRFVHEAKTGAKEYSVNDWVSISTDVKDYGIKNPDYFYKFYEKI
jgi:hypothetical protein